MIRRLFWRIRFDTIGFITGRACCNSTRFGPHYRFCLARYMTRRERLAAVAWRVRGWTPWWCQ